MLELQVLVPHKHRKAPVLFQTSVVFSGLYTGASQVQALLFDNIFFEAVHLAKNELAHLHLFKALFVDIRHSLFLFFAVQRCESIRDIFAEPDGAYIIEISIVSFCVPHSFLK